LSFAIAKGSISNLELLVFVELLIEMKVKELSVSFSLKLKNVFGDPKSS